MVRVALKVKMPTEISFSGMSSSSVAQTFNYFAYGSNLSSERIRVSNPSAQAIGPALLENYALDFNYHSKVLYNFLLQVFCEPPYLNVTLGKKRIFTQFVFPIDGKSCSTK